MRMLVDNEFLVERHHFVAAGNKEIAFDSEDA
jgi:hypothetical protein